MIIIIIKGHQNINMVEKKHIENRLIADFPGPLSKFQCIQGMEF